MIKTAVISSFISLASVAFSAEFKHVGDFLLQSHFKLVGQQITPIPTKPIAFRVFSDGIHIRVSAEGEEDSHSTFEIYRSDGIARQRQGAGAIEIIPGLQASSNSGGTLRHLRLSRESMTITSFPAVSDQTVVSHSVAATPTQAPTAKP